MTTDRSPTSETKAIRAARRAEQFARLRATALSTTVLADLPKGIPADGPMTIVPGAVDVEAALADMALPLVELPPAPQVSKGEVEAPQSAATSIDPPGETKIEPPTSDEPTSKSDAPGHLSVQRSIPPFRFDAAESSVPRAPLALPAFSLTGEQQAKTVEQGRPYPVGELYRGLRGSVLDLLPAGEPAAMVWLSPTGSEEASHHLAEFAAALAETGQGDVLLIDTKVQTGDLSRRFALEARPGLAEVLAKKLHPQDAGQETAIPRVHVLPLGGKEAPRLVRRADEDRWRILLPGFKDRYHYVLIDAPGAEEPHCLPMAKAADATFLVIGLDYTPRETVQEALETLQLHKANVAGCVLTDPPR